MAAWIWPEGREGVGSGPRTPDQVRQILDAQIAHWQVEGFGWWWWRERESGQLVGEAGLQRATVDGQKAVEAGWTLLPEHWGKGFASEAAAAALDYGFRLAGLRAIVALTLPDNDPLARRDGPSGDGAGTRGAPRRPPPRACTGSPARTGRSSVARRLACQTRFTLSSEPW